MIIAYMGFDMLRGHQTVGQASPADDDTAAPSSLAPLIMFAAGPGTITAVVTLVRLAQHHAHARLDVPVEEVQLDAEQPDQLRSRRSRHGAAG